MDALPALSPVACRVLGSLLEKERTVPATYPLTMHAVVAACNQTTGRDPVMVVDEAAAGAAIDELRAAGLARLVHASHGARSVKYRQARDRGAGARRSSAGGAHDAAAAGAADLR